MNLILLIYILVIIRKYIIIKRVQLLLVLHFGQINYISPNCTLNHLIIKDSIKLGFPCPILANIICKPSCNKV